MTHILTFSREHVSALRGAREEVSSSAGTPHPQEGIVMDIFVCTVILPLLGIIVFIARDRTER